VSLAAEADRSLAELLTRQRDLLAQLRDVEHWHRLTAARLDLAIAAVTDIDELSVRALSYHRSAPSDLHGQIGIPAAGQALPEAAAVIRLRRVLSDLESYAAALRQSCAEISARVVDQLAAEGYLEAYCHTLQQQPNDHESLRRAVTPRRSLARRMGRTTARTSPSVISLVANPADGDER
jgi:hypothetical protein